MREELFVDGISGIGFGKGAVRIDFFAMSPDALDGKGKPAKEHRQRLVMTTEGFAEAFTLLSGIMEKLQRAGMLPTPPTPRPGEKAGTATDTATGAASPSPNF